jgi:hypothetical protein
MGVWLQTGGIHWPVPVTVRSRRNPPAPSPRSKRSFLFDVGAGIGYALVLTKGVENIAAGQNASSYSNSASNKPYGSLIGDIGFFF